MYLVALCTLFFLSCKKPTKQNPVNFNSVTIETLLKDSLLSVRAITILNDKNLAFAANNGAYGIYNPDTKQWQTAVQQYDSLTLNFRAVAHTANDFFMLTTNTPALLFKTGNSGKMELVYKEEGQDVFYDAMAFWNNKEGIAIGDSVDGCLSIIITRDGGLTWQKLTCEDLPVSHTSESAFAASNTNIKIVGNKTWVGTANGNMYFSENKGKSWQVVKTPIISEEATQGIYSVDFYDSLNGFAIGGDYTNPDANEANKIQTSDGGKTWHLVASGKAPGYRSCVQYVPNGFGNALVAVGFKGVDFSSDAGATWQHLSDQGFYTIKFLNDSIAYAAGSGSISKITFRHKVLP